MCACDDPRALDTALDGLMAAHREALAPVTASLLELARIEPGQRVLDVGSGTGDMAVLAAGRVGPDGHVLATDVEPNALAKLLARSDAAAWKDRLAARPIAAEDLVPDSAPFDAALARNCLMYFRDLPRALVNVRRLLRPGGRFVVSLYGPLEHEPFHAIPVAAVERRRAVTAPLPQFVQAFRVSAGHVVAALEAAGFRGIERHVVRTTRSYPSLPEAIAWLHHSPSLADLLSRLDEPDREAAWADIAAGFRPYAGAAGLVLPGEQVVVLAVAQGVTR